DPPNRSLTILTITSTNISTLLLCEDGAIWSILQSRCEPKDVRSARMRYKHETRGKLYYACPRSKPHENTFGCKKNLWKEERVRLLVGSPGASTTPIYSPGSSSTLIYSPGSSTPPRYSPGASTPPSYSLGTSRNAECSNCKHLLDKITKFNLEANAEINFSFKLSSFDFAVDITDDAEVQFFVGCACNSKDEFAQLFVSERKNDQKNMFFNFFESTTLENEGPSNPEITSSHLNNSYNNTSFLNNGISFDLGQNDFHINDSLQLQNEPHFSNPESSFAFRSNEYNTDDVVNENPQKKFHKWQKFMSFEPDIPETPVYKAKPNISKQYTQQSEVEKGNIFDNKEALMLAVRLKALNEGFQFLTDRSAPERCHLKCYHFNQCDWKLRARLWDNTERYYITHLNDVHTCPKTQTYPNHRNANKKVIGHLLTPKLQDRSRVLRGKDIQQDILSEYKIHISYQQAMKGKHYGIQQVRGSPYEAFEMLPYYCYNLEQKNEGTVTRIKTDDQGVFEMLFIAIGASFPENSLEVLKLLENSVEVLKILENKLESMKILENKLESLKLHVNQPVDELVPPSTQKIYIQKCFREAVKE
ncbi:hypothetical protein Tco_0583748, partial [Tanacetum coccineum]